MASLLRKSLTLLSLACSTLALGGAPAGAQAFQEESATVRAPGTPANPAEAAFSQDYQTYQQFLNQISSISQLRDVSPQDWSYEALRNLVENYGCIVGYPDGTYRGNRPLTRNEFAAGLNACLTQLEKRMLTSRNQAQSVNDPTLTQFRRLSVQPGEDLDSVFNRAFYNQTGRFYELTDISGQANKIFGWRTFPGSFMDNMIRDDALTVETIYQDALQQQQRGTDVRTLDIPNPFDRSLQGNPNYLRSGETPVAPF
ncbi:MAG: iron uptake porin [Cyanobacteria bacterium RI_101]|nr:iron uptake porin [Cyanobacteria bacterium RI_101]